MKEYMEAFDLIKRWMVNHKNAMYAFCAIWVCMHIILNIVYCGKAVPITGMVLQNWMAGTNIALVSITAAAVCGWLEFGGKH